MQRKPLDRFGEWTMISAAAYGAALLGLFTFRELHASLSGDGVHSWWPNFASLDSSANWIPLVLLWGTAFVAPAIWSLDRTNLWKTIPQIGVAAVVASALLAADLGWLGATLATLLLFGTLSWIRCHRHQIYDARKHLTGYGSGRRS